MTIRKFANYAAYRESPKNAHLHIQNERLCRDSMLSNKRALYGKYCVMLRLTCLPLCQRIVSQFVIIPC